MKTETEKPLRCNLRHVRKVNGYSVSYVAGAVGLTRITIYAIERGANLHVSNAQAIARLFECQMEDLWPK